MSKIVNPRVHTFTAPGVLPHDGSFGAWMARNVGTDTAEVMGVPLAPGEILDFTNLGSECVWNQDIPVAYASSTAKVCIITLTIN